MNLTDRAMEEGEKRWPHSAADTIPERGLTHAERMNRRIGFEVGAQWRASLPPTGAELEAMARAMAEHECKGKPWEQIHENVRDIYRRLATVGAAALADARRSG